MSSSLRSQAQVEGVIGGVEREEAVHGDENRAETPLASRVAQGVSGHSLSCVWIPRVFADDARGWQCPFVLCLHHPLLAWTTLFIHRVFAKASIVPASPVFYGAQIVAELQGLPWKEGLLPWRPGLSDKTTRITWNSNLKIRPFYNFSPGFFTEYHMSIGSLDMQVMYLKNRSTE